ncbi:MAG: hypothetical protein WBM53_12685 [Maribacter sp.]
MKRPISSYLLNFLLFVLAIAAIPAGWNLIFDPSGVGIGFSEEVLGQLEHSPFSNFLVPGLFLFVILGLLPLLTLYGLTTKKKSSMAQKINLYPNYHWAWTVSYYIGMVLILWINMQLLFGIAFYILHFVCTLLGVLIIFITHLPITKRYYRLLIVE